MQSFKLKFLGVTILQGVEFPIFLLIFEWALQQCSATALPVMCIYTTLSGAVADELRRLSCQIQIQFIELVARRLKIKKLNRQ